MSRAPRKLVLDTGQSGSDRKSGNSPVAPKSGDLGPASAGPKSNNGERKSAGRLPMDPSFASSQFKSTGKSKSKGFAALLPSLAAQAEAQEVSRKQHVTGNVAAGYIPPQYVAMGYRAAASTSGALQTRKSSGGQPAAAAAAASPTSRPYPRSSTESGTVATATAAAAAATSPSTKSHTAVAAASQPALSSRLATRESYVDVEDALLAATRSLGGSSDFSDGGTGTGGESSSPAKSASPDRHRRRTRQGLTKRVSIALSASSGSGDSETGSDSGSQAESDVNSDLGLNFSSAVRAQRSQSELMTRPPSLAYPDAGQLKPTRSIIRRSTVTESDERISPGSPGSATAASPSRPQSSRVKFDHLSSPTGPRSRLPSTGGALVPTISKVNAAAQGQRQPSFLGVSLSGMEELGAHAESSGGAPYVRIATGVPSGTMDVVSAFSGLASPDFATAVPFQRTRSGLSSMGGYTEHRKSLDARNGPSGLRVSQGAVTSQQSRMRSQPGSQDNVTQAPVPRCVDDIDQSGKVRRTVAMPVVAPAEDETPDDDF